MIMRVGLYVVLIAAGLPGFAGADIPLNEIETYARDAFNREVTVCDTLAAHPKDPERVTDGVTRDAMDTEAAIAACQAAVEADPDNPRLRYQLGRALDYTGDFVNSSPHRDAALRSGYPQSLFVVGYIRINGWDGSEPDPCYAGELIRRSAVAGRLAGLLGYPHYVSMGEFDACTALPQRDEEEIRGFLSAAKERNLDYPQTLLVAQLDQAFAASE